MHLFLSDLHLGREPDSTSRDAERDAVELLHSYENNLTDGGRLFLVGDVFHAYIEYKHLIPKCGARLIGALARWVDHGIPITYLVGNRDPWHVDFFEDELGVQVIQGALSTHLFGRHTYVSHGDVELSRNPIAARFRSLVRHPTVAKLYRNSFPGDAALGFAQWFSRTFGTDGATETDADEALEALSLERLHTTTHDLVVHGHTHRPRLIERSSGTYVNPGYWFADRTFAVLSEEGPALFRWSDGRATPLNLPSD